MVTRLFTGLVLGLALVATACQSTNSSRGDTGGIGGSYSSASRDGEWTPEPLAEGETGCAYRVSKILTMDSVASVIDDGMLVVRDGKLEYVGPPVELPEGFPLEVYEGSWAYPGLVDLHTHVHARGSFGDINDMVFPVNTDLRTTPTVVPSTPPLKVACASGVTTLFGIPGSGTSISGFGTLYKTKTDADFDEIVLRDPGGMKAAQNFNPQGAVGGTLNSWAGLGWNTEQHNDAIAARVERGAELGWDEEYIARVHSGDLPVLIHCASAEGVANTVRMWKVRYGAQAVVSHGSWDGHKVGYYAAEHGVPVNHGPRIYNFNSSVREEKFQGGAQSFVDQGVPLFSLNTDSPIVPQHELFLQATMSARLGADAYQMVEAVTTNPARSFAIGHRVGSLETGKDADIVISAGDPLDPRARVELVLIDGEVQYSRNEDGQWF